MTGKLLLSVALLATLGTATAQERHKTVSGLEAQTTSVAAAAENTGKTENIYSYVNHDDQLRGLGVGGHAHIQCGSLFPGKTFEAVKGNKLTAIRIKLYATAHQINQRIWIREDLNADPVYVEDVVVNKPKEWQEFTLKTPYLLNGQDFYIGLDLEVTADAETQDEKWPIGANFIPRPNANFMNIDHYRWDDYTVDGLGALMIEAVVDGKLVENDVALLNVQGAYAAKNEKKIIEGTLLNCTRDFVKDIELTYRFGEEEKTIKVPLEYTVRQMEESPFQFEVTMPDFTGEQKMEVTINKVNGKVDGYMANNNGSSVMQIMLQKAHRRVVMEEITGTWCGFCIVGVTAFERLQKDFADDIICIAAHGPNPTDDKFTCGGYIPLMNRAGDKYPRAIINRKGDMFHPYFGRTNSFYGVKELVDAELKEYVPADVKLADVELIDNGTKLRMTGAATFYMDRKDCPYQLAYALLEDKLTGTQHNELSGNDITDEYLKKYTKMPADIENFEFNDVARGIYPYEGTPGSLAGPVKAGVAKTHQYTVYLTNTKVENWDNCRLVVMLIDQRDGTIVNANQMSLKGMKGTGIQTVEKEFKADLQVEDGLLHVKADKEATVEVYAPQGLLVAKKTFNEETTLAADGWKGVYLVRISDGYHVAVEKVCF